MFVPIIGPPSQANFGDVVSEVFDGQPHGRHFAPSVFSGSQGVAAPPLILPPLLLDL